MSDALIREVQEDLQRDRAIALAKRYGGWVAALALLLVLGTAAYVGWQNWQAKVRQDESAKLYAALTKLETGQSEAALTDLEAVGAETSDGIAALARFQAAQAAGAAGKADEATQNLEQVAGSSLDDAILKEAARLAVLGRQLDAGDPAQLIAGLEPLAAGDRPFRHQARELLGLARLRAGDTAGAKATFDDALKDPSLPIRAKARLTEYRAALESAA
ncbi:MAG TPA: tetratricopeptide repeat protein [Geminicoccus sp.]|uniref:tetratricopeptide repeat protein n=1 Tax=Geminicoccus sp. TaxID=2024832 RepID=UPI002B9CB70A|nr:tetratricopeptide repeat protein [Geminicoccus sp.]HWL71243.1 tetratricopeptide repeat protein [Geminicoccus sp.]